MTQSPHIPVMLQEVLACFANDANEKLPLQNKHIIDGTFGAGGYTRALLNLGARVTAFDQDPNAINAGQAMVEEFAGRLTLIHAPFSSLADEITEQVDGVVFDVGVSSMQLDQAERGFSFRYNAPLDMRMSASGVSAADICNSYSDEAIANILYRYGDEKASRRIAREIIAARPLATTQNLVKCVEKVIRPYAKQKIAPATRTFQALRIAVNDELRELIEGLVGAYSILKEEGCLCVVSFHSLEDGIVKQFFKGAVEDNPIQSRHMPPYNHAARFASAPGSLPTAFMEKPKLFHQISRKALVPSEQELDINLRARSAKLRYGFKEKTDNLFGKQQINLIRQYLLKSYVI